jgi:alpha-mannosidase
LITKVLNTAPATGDSYKSMLDIKGSGLDITAINAVGNDLIIRVFNAEGDDAAKKITFDGTASKAELVELDGRKRQDLTLQNTGGKTTLSVALPRFGIRTIKLYNAVKAE